MLGKLFTRTHVSLFQAIYVRYLLPATSQWYAVAGNGTIHVRLTSH